MADDDDDNDFAESYSGIGFRSTAPSEAVPPNNPGVPFTSSSALTLTTHPPLLEGCPEDVVTAPPSPGTTDHHHEEGGIMKDPMSVKVQEARDRAMAIIRQFQTTKESTHPLLSSSLLSSSLLLSSSSISSPLLKRKAALEQLDQRKQSAMVKNLEYLAKMEEDRIRTNLIKVQQAQSDQQELEALHQQSLEMRRFYHHSSTTTTTTGSVPSTQAGIGTLERHRADDRQRRTQDRSTKAAQDDTVAVYVANLPTNGSVNETVLRTLFGSLGYKLRKIHLYIHKDTNELKGDALVVYELPPDQDRTMVTETVCTQVRTCCCLLFVVQYPHGRSMTTGPRSRAHLILFVCFALFHYLSSTID